jgi:polyribonucleotide nucleotidyltransferase
MHNSEISLGGRALTIETGKWAKQADGSVIVRMGDTMVLVTACHAGSPREGIDFLPLTVDYREYAYSSGRIPGGFFKREGKATEKETLTSRLIDRPIRPLFPTGWAYETQVIALSFRRTPTTTPTCWPSPAPRRRSPSPRCHSKRPSPGSGSASSTARMW